MYTFIHHEGSTVYIQSKTTTTDRAGLTASRAPRTAQRRGPTRKLDAEESGGEGCPLPKTMGLRSIV